MSRARFRSAIALSLIFAGVCTAAGQQQPRERRPAARGQRPLERLEYFYRQRQYPLGFIPDGARLRAFEQAQAKRRAEASQQQATAAGMETAATTSAWTEIGPRPLAYSDLGEVSGRVTAIAIDPGNNNIVYIGTADGGVWKTTDGGANWTPLTDSQPSLSVGAIAVAPSNTSVIYVGLGDQSFYTGSYSGMGVLKSTDAGASWTLIQGPFYGPFRSIPYYGGAHIGAVAVHASNPNLVLAAVEMASNTVPGDRSGIWRSTDGGNTWSVVLAGAPATEVMFDPVDANVVWAALGKGPTSDVAGAWGVYKSTDSGATWRLMNGSGSTGLPAYGSPGRIALAVQHSAGTAVTLYAGVADANASTYGNLLGLYKSGDGGATWTRLANTPAYCADGGVPQCWYDNALDVHPGNAKIIFAGGSAGQSLYRSVDGGITWAGMLTGANGVKLHNDQQKLKFTKDASVLYLGNGGGMWKATTPAGASVNYINLNHTLGTIQFNPGVSISRDDLNTSYAGSQDNGAARYSGTAQWQRMELCEDGGYTAIDPRAPSTIFAGCTYVSPRRSYDGGATWYYADQGININDDAAFIAPFVMDPLAPNTMYFGTYRVWQTRNATGSWSAVSGDLTKGTGVISTIAIAPGNSDWAYVGTDDGNVQVTYHVNTYPVTWNLRTAGLPNRAVSSVAISAVSPGTAYATFSGFSYGADTLGHVFKTTNAGLNWTDISNGLPNAPANDIAIDPDIAGTLYVATDVGVFRSVDDGLSWSALMNGLPGAAVTALRLHPASRTLRAATHGRGMWDLVVPFYGGITLSPAAVDFGTVVLGQSSSPQQVTLTNRTGVGLRGIAAGTSGDFNLVPGGTCGASLAQAQSCTFVVSFTPAAAGTRTGALSVVVPGATTVTAALSGTGGGLPAVSLLPATLGFGPEIVGKTSVPLTVTLTNVGSAALSIASTQVSAEFTFAVPPACTSLAPSATCRMDIAFAPQSSGAKAGALTVTDDAAGSPHSVALSGTATTTAEPVDPAYRPSPVTRRTAGGPEASPGTTAPAGTGSGSSTPGTPPGATSPPLGKRNDMKPK